MNYILIIIMILSSGTALGWSIPGFGTIQLVLSMLGLGIYMMKKHNLNFKRRNFFILFASLAILVFNIILTSGLQVALMYYDMYFMLFSVYIIAEIMPFGDFSKRYVNVFFVLGLFSIIFWGLAQFNVSIADFSVLANNGVYYRMNPLYIYRSVATSATLMHNNSRNFGIFWEPGAFQGYLNLALMFLLFDDSPRETKKAKKFYYLKVIVLIATILSTQSTTGYLILILMFIVYYFQRVLENKLTTRYIVVAFVVIIAAFVILNSDVVRMKFDQDSSSFLSTSIRLNDNLNGINAVFISPIVGLGFNSTAYYSVMKSYGIIANSSGLLIVLQQFGLFIGVLILVRLFYNLGKCLRINGFSIVIYILLMIMLMSAEAFATKEIFVIFLFSFQSKVPSLGTQIEHNFRG